MVGPLWIHVPAPIPWVGPLWIMSHVSPNTQEVVGLLPDCAIPFPRLGCLTFCACKAGNVYQTEKGGVKTSELLVVDRKNGTLAMYDTLYDALSGLCCYCTNIVVQSPCFSFVNDSETEQFRCC